MAQVKIKDSWHAEKETVYVNENSYVIGRGKDAWINMSDADAELLDSKIYEIKGKESKPEEVKVIEEPKEEVIEDEESEIVEEVKEEVVEEVVKEVKVKKASIMSRVKDYAEDLMDDGKRNNSNNPNKKSPGRKKKK